MTWHYQATHRVVDGHDVYEVREVYVGIEGDDDVSWTMDAIAPFGNTKEELIECLELMLADVKKYPVLEVDA
ncbi:MAG: hypothetical protein PHU04_05620 [Candidatus Peribacteraceae bacterium]|nr:hypothetical protein [Candidatus Peribacteraceae bacterium]